MFYDLQANLKRQKQNKTKQTSRKIRLYFYLKILRILVFSCVGIMNVYNKIMRNRNTQHLKTYAKKKKVEEKKKIKQNKLRDLVLS